ncbi:MAG: hypothetical protein AB7D03_09010 [Thiomicrospira sp.]
MMYLVVKRGVSVLVVLLAVLGLVACQTSDSSTESTRLFVVEAGQGEFSATADEDIFQLTTRAHKADVVWFDDRPSVDTGIETLDQFFDRIWPGYFAIFPPSVALVMRTSDGEWLLSSAQVLSMTQPQSGEAIWTLKMENRLDFQPLDRVLIYLDNEGGLLPANETHTFMQAAAEGAFVAINDTDYALELRAPMDTLMMLAVTPNYDSQLIENSLFVNELWQGFIAAPPNAAVTIADAQGAVTTHIVTLSQPSWDAHNQRFRYRVTPCPVHCQASLARRLSISTLGWMTAMIDAMALLLMKKKSIRFGWLIMSRP